MKGLKKNVSSEGFMKDVRLAYEIMQRTEPQIMNRNWLEMLPELRREDVVYFDCRTRVRRSAPTQTRR